MFLWNSKSHFCNFNLPKARVSSSTRSVINISYKSDKWKREMKRQYFCGLPGTRHVFRVKVSSEWAVRSLSAVCLVPSVNCVWGSVSDLCSYEQLTADSERETICCPSPRPSQLRAQLSLPMILLEPLEISASSLQSFIPLHVALLIEIKVGSR